MASNSFGNIFRVTTFGESHGAMLGAVIDGCPAGILIESDEINKQLAKRAPGSNKYVSPRKERDKAEIVSGVFEGRTTGTPITIIIRNCDHKLSVYEPIRDILRPGHANYTYLEKYGVFDYHGGGRASGRETVCRVAAGVVANKILEKYGVEVFTYLDQVGVLKVNTNNMEKCVIKRAAEDSAMFCPDQATESKIERLLNKTMKAGDSIGGAVSFCALNVPIGLGEPIFEKVEAKLAAGLLSIPGCKGFEIGDGFESGKQNGSSYNDTFTIGDGENKPVLESNHAGGVLGGISSGMPVIGKVVFKPTSSICKEQNSVSLNGEKVIFRMPTGSRHDPCIAIRAVPVVEAMCSIVFADLLLMNRSARLS